MHADVQSILFSEEEIAARVSELGAQITRDFAPLVAHDPRGLVLVTVLRGAAVFTADLARAIALPVEMDYVAVSSYGAGAKSSGVVSLQKDLTTDIAGRHVLIAEDILDSGLTLSRLSELLAARGPASLSIATLLRKETGAQAAVECRYQGFTCPDEFIVGYGLDYAERYRNLPYIGVLKPEVYEKQEA